MSREYANFKIVGKEGHGKFSGRECAVSVTDHDGHTEYIEPDAGVSARAAALCWFRLTYSADGAEYAGNGERYKLMTRFEDHYRVERLNDSDYVKDSQTGDLFAAPQGDPDHGGVIAHS